MSTRSLTSPDRKAQSLTLSSVLRSLRDESGGPNVKTRLVALLAAIGLLVVAAPVVISLVRWIADLIW
jgi:hypothetical protein